MASMPPTRKKPFPEVRTAQTTPAAAAMDSAIPASGTAVGPTTRTAPTQEEIARAAYLRWQRQGGDPVANWLAAEAELKAGARSRS